MLPSLPSHPSPAGIRVRPRWPVRSASSAPAAPPRLRASRRCRRRRIPVVAHASDSAALPRDARRAPGASAQAFYRAKYGLAERPPQPAGRPLSRLFGRRKAAPADAEDDDGGDKGPAAGGPGGPGSA